MNKRIYLTVDTECHKIEEENRYLWGNTSNGVYGIEKILLLGKELNIPINFMVDFPEASVYGKEHIQKIVRLIRDYHQPIYLHVHPDYIGDRTKKHLWEYSKEEQKSILSKALQQYCEYCGDYDVLVFRAGAWGVNKDTYEVLREIVPKEKAVVDLSYVYKSRRRCHLSYQEAGSINAIRKVSDVIMFPNTTYIGFDYFGKQYALGLSVPDPNYGVFKAIIDQNHLSQITYTMHSWDFIKRWFFLPGKIAGNHFIIHQFRKCVKYAQRKGYVFSDLADLKYSEEPDQCINLCNGLWGKIKCLIYNYRTFSHNGRYFKKYAFLYFSKYILLMIFVLCLVFGVFLK